jgi:hypothetical protein
VKDRIKPESRYKLKKFIDDEMLNRIRLDKTLFHIPKSHGSYVDARTGRLPSSGKRVKEKVYPIQGESAENDDSTDHVARKVRKCPPKCVVCCALSDPKDKESKISQTTIHCSLCLVALCIKKKGKRKSSCFEIFHQIDDLNWLRGKPESSIEAPGDTLLPGRGRHLGVRRTKVIYLGKWICCVKASEITSYLVMIKYAYKCRC